MKLRSIHANPTLTDFVPHVVALRSEEKVRGVDTGRNITFMTDKQPFRNRPVMKFIGQSVCLHRDTTCMDRPIVIGALASRPIPAAFGFVYVIPKAAHQFCGAILVRLGVGLRLQIEYKLDILFHGIASTKGNAHSPAVHAARGFLCLILAPLSMFINVETKSDYL